MSLAKRSGLFPTPSIFLLVGAISVTGAQDMVHLYEIHLPEIVLQDKNSRRCFILS